ncbi:hypothetical protein [Pyxidicoccus xibeiensis]|uniref:hypothetical protein n=1 Tax=Pyxidicoccus xibeiensis TaxID=2906759 RepID=UPI0020A81FD4|nr:hypothetical protein [Pyxidicoccus xibeiensis]MCP3141878.1 hypothetical protein [Pyxidicoccus xibeiensis]
MSVGPASGSRSNGTSEQEAARRAAEEARRAAAEAARRAAEAARKAAEAQAQQAAEAARKANTAFEGMPRNEQFDKRLGAETPATSLLTEDARDGQVNCLDVAADWANKATPELRARSEMVFLEDTRSGTEGESGHVVIRQGEQILDPTTNKSYESMEAFKKAEPHYQEAGSLSARHVKNILDTPPGSPERAEALARARVPAGLQKMMVADEKPPSSAEQAAKDYDGVIKGRASGAEPNSLFTELVKEKQHDPEYLAQLVKSAKEDGILEELVDPRLSKSGNPLDSSLFDKNDKGEYSSKAIGAGEVRKHVLMALDAAKAKGIITDQEIGALAQKSEPWKSIVQEMHPGWAGPRVAGTEIRSAKARFDATHAKVHEKQEELQRLLSGFGTALTPAQQQKLVKKFKSEPGNQAIFDAEAQATKDLAATLEKHKEGILKSAATNPSGAKDLYKSLQAIANSGAAKTALDFSIDIKKDPALAKAFEGFKDFDKDITEPAISNGISQYIAEDPKDPKGAIAAFQKKLDELGGIKGVADDIGKPMFDLQGGAAKFMQGLTDMSLPPEKRQTLLQNLADEFKGQSPIAKGLMKASLVAWSVQIGDSKLDSSTSEAISEAIKEFTKAGQGTAELFAGAAQSLVDAEKYSKAGKLARSADFVARITPGLALLANSASAWVNANKLASGEGNPGHAVALAGDVLGIVGGALEAFPLTAPAGALVGGLGAGINAVGEVAASIISGEEKSAEKEKAFKDKRAEYLHSVLNDPDLERTLLDADGEVVHKLTQDLKLPPKDVQALAKKYPSLLYTKESLAQLDGLKKTADQLKLAPSQVVDFLNDVGRGAEDPSMALQVVLQRFAPGEVNSLSEVKTRDALVAGLKQAYKEYGPDDSFHDNQPDAPSFEKGYENAIRAAGKL